MKEEPTKTELKDYLKFIKSFSRYHGGDLLRKIHDELWYKTFPAYQEKEKWELIHPAVLISCRKQGNCVDKSFALADICDSYGLKTKFPVATSIESNPFKHMWVRFYTKKSYVDLDPTISNYVLLIREDPSLISL